MKTITFFKIAALVLVSVPISAQEAQFSQYYNTFQLLNPAFVGSSGHRFRANLNSRFQTFRLTEKGSDALWTSTYFSNAVSGQIIFGHPLGKNENVSQVQKASSTFFSVGTSLLTNHQTSKFRMTKFYVSPAVNMRLSKRTYLNFGMEATLGQFVLEDYVLVSDYLNRQPISQASLSNTSFNLSTGALLIHKSLWLGLAVKDALGGSNYVRRDTESLLVDQGGKSLSNIYVHGGWSFPLNFNRDHYLASSFSFRNRSENRQFEAGFGYYRAYQSGYGWSAALAYRGLEIKRIDLNLINTDAYIAIVGFNNIPFHSIGALFDKEKRKSDKYEDKGNISITLSTDFLYPNYSTVANTWELSIVVNASSKKSTNKGGKYTCEDFLPGPMASQIDKNFYGGIPPYEDERTFNSTVGKDKDRQKRFNSYDKAQRKKIRQRSNKDLRKKKMKK